MKQISTDVAIIGAGIVGIATAYYLAKNHNVTDICLIDRDQPMAFTSAQSGENYRNWWPHPAMVAFTNRSINLMEEIAIASNNQINMSRRGYSLATRSDDISELVKQLHMGLGETATSLLRYHDSAYAPGYQRQVSPDWSNVPLGVDILRNQKLIRETFPSYAYDIKNIIHIRRGGDINGQLLGLFMLNHLKEIGLKRIVAMVEGIVLKGHYQLILKHGDSETSLKADRIINAAGPFADKIANMIGVDLPVFNTFQQKIAFEDRKGAIPRNMPFSIDLDEQKIDWTEQEREVLLDSQEFRWLAENMPGAIHCRPDGGDNGAWVKLGWAFNEAKADATWEPPLDSNFPEFVLRGAARLNPSLKTYYGQLPRGMHHYGGWYTMTEENWPLIGQMGSDSAFMNCAHSGFGTMASCAGGELCAAWAAGENLPSYAKEFSIARYKNKALMKTLYEGNKGVL